MEAKNDEEEGLATPSLTTSPEGLLPCPLDIPGHCSHGVTIKYHQRTQRDRLEDASLATRSDPRTLTTNKHQDGGSAVCPSGLDLLRIVPVVNETQRPIYRKVDWSEALPSSRRYCVYIMT
jgi:hypothetical protein